MQPSLSGFDELHVLHELKHYLPAQAPLKDFVHHNTLHAYQNREFFEGITCASTIFGYKVTLSLAEFRNLFETKRINADVLSKIIREEKGEDQLQFWLENLLEKEFDTTAEPRIGQLRNNWKRIYKLDLDSAVFPTLFRVLGSYLDQGIAIWNFPSGHNGFLHAIKELERNSFISFFKTEQPKKILLEGQPKISNLLHLLVGDEALYEQYLFDQQFAHQGWSGIVSVIEQLPESLLDRRIISLKDVIIFELLLEIDALNFKFGNTWAPLATKLTHKPTPLFQKVEPTELNQTIILWQKAFEWTYYDQVLKGVSTQPATSDPQGKGFQGLFCIDDRICSFRRYIEQLEPECETYGTPGFFASEFFYQPEDGKFVTKVCPAPLNPGYVIKEYDSKNKRKKDVHLNKQTHFLLGGWLISQTVGFWSAMRLFLQIFKPTMSPATASSFKHMDKFSKLTIECEHPEHKEHGLQVGYTVAEMAVRVESQLRSIGLVKNFASIIYIVGHGSSSVNNPYYAAYDCGACSGRPGSVNARVFSFMGNHKKVRAILRERGIDIPQTTQFVSALHDTAADEIMFYDEQELSAENRIKHEMYEVSFKKALDLNAKERSRRFMLIDSKDDAAKVHEKVKQRTVSLFEPRPELNHASNALCIVGGRELSKGLFLDRRSFLNSYYYRIDPEGDLLFGILKAVAPVCGGINLEYFFSRTDNQKLGAGSKLPHNVVGLFGVANGIEGDLRPGLPKQMIEVHDPVRLMVIVEHHDEVILKTIQRNADTFEWFQNEWVKLSAIHPLTREITVFSKGKFIPYNILSEEIETLSDVMPLIESFHDNFPVYAIS